MLYFCTLFDSNYASRGLAMYRSLAERSNNFILYVYCFDGRVHQLLQTLALPNLVPVSLEEFETTDLLRVKKERSRAEYCWTCTPHVISDALDRFGLDAVTYLDADLWFFASPGVLIDEFDRSNASVMLTEHRFTPGHEKALVRGKYCVQFMSFRNDDRGRVPLRWWCDRCLEWCYDRLEEGKFGDQKYLDDWIDRFEGVHILQNPGGGVAPWNAGRYRFALRTGTLVATEKKSKENFPIIFYHFHHVRMYDNGRVDLGHFRLPRELRLLAYAPYLSALEREAGFIRTHDDSFDPHGIRSPAPGLFERLVRIKRWLKGSYPTYHSLLRS